MKAEIAGLAARLASEWPETNSRRRFDAILDFDYRLNRAGGVSIMIILVVLLVMAIAAVNVANLFLARVEERRRELEAAALVGAGPQLGGLGTPLAVLAGGLTPENVEDAIAAVQPYGVDVSSGVEDAPGLKNAQKVALFLANAQRGMTRLQAGPRS